jgi:hypothetical protein
MTTSTEKYEQGDRTMKTGTFRLKGSSLLARAKENGVENRHQLSFKANVSHQSVYSLFDGTPMTQMNLYVLAKILIVGLGYTPDELMDVKFGEIFEYVDPDELGAAD